MFAVKKDRSKLIKAAMQLIPCDLTVKNIIFFNVFTGEKYPAEVDILDGVVVRVRENGEETSLKSKDSFDGKGAILIPGFIDTHMHVESTMMLPEQVSRAIIPWGTTTICTDPHEIANVMGVTGVEFMINNAKRSHLRQFNLAPSCIPAVPGLETCGAVFGPDEIGELLEKEEVVGIAELMDFVGVYSDSERMRTIIDKGLEKGAFLQGHSPAVKGKELAAYLISGPESDHESYDGEELREKIRNGMRVDLRSSTIIDTVKDLVTGLDGHKWFDNVSICTDDVHASDLLSEGHINSVIKKAIAAGMDPDVMIKCATLNAAREIGFKDLGAIAPGYVADFQLVRAFDGNVPEAVFIGGVLLAENGKYLGTDRISEDLSFPNTVNVKGINSAKDFDFLSPQGGNKVTVNVMIPLDDANILRKCEPMELPVIDGVIQIEDDMQYVCVCNRYGSGAKTIAAFKGFGLREGAFASTVTHDCHNFIVVYKDSESAFKAYSALKDCGGGMCVVKDGEVTVLELPVAGLMSTLDCEHVANRVDFVQSKVREIAKPDMSILATSIMSLCALPGVVITDLGLVDGIEQKFVPIFSEISRHGKIN